MLVLMLMLREVTKAEWNMDVQSVRPAGLEPANPLNHSGEHLR
jgi:hypothetical protein